MANATHLETVMQGTYALQYWRANNPGVRLELSGADLSNRPFSKVDLSGADLTGADLSGADLKGANLTGACLQKASLNQTVLHDALLDGADDPVPLNTCYVAAMPSRCVARRVLAWLRAPALSAVARLLAPPAMHGYARFNAAVVGALPLPPAVLADPALDAGDPAPLDLVADHLHLAPAERRTLEGLLG